jgi:hypothetical protein
VFRNRPPNFVFSFQLTVDLAQIFSLKSVRNQLTTCSFARTVFELFEANAELVVFLPTFSAIDAIP